jgi:hypothetical protein
MVSVDRAREITVDFSVEISFDDHLYVLPDGAIEIPALPRCRRSACMAVSAAMYAAPDFSEDAATHIPHDIPADHT